MDGIRVSLLSESIHLSTLTLEEFLVVPAGRLGTAHRAAVGGVGLPVHEADAGPRTHPLLERWAAAVVVEQRREELERDACRAFLAADPIAPLVVDGALTDLAGAAGAERAIGVAKQHETQFLEGNDLAVALTLPAGSRSSIFRRETGGAGTHSWYLRLWPWPDEDLLHGLVRGNAWAPSRETTPIR